MWTNYLKIAIRRLFKNRFYTLINLVGLSVGFASVLIIFLFIKKERSFDQFHAKLNNIEYLVKVTERETGETRSTGTPAPLLPAGIGELTQVEEYATYQRGILVTRTDSLLSTNEEVRISQVLTDSGFFNIFDFKLKYGRYPDFINEANSLMLTEANATLLFGDAKLAIGKLVKTVSGTVHEVKGVLFNLPETSSIQFGAVSSLENAYPIGSNTRYMLESWGNNIYQNVLLFKDGTTENQKSAMLTKLESIYTSRTQSLQFPMRYELKPLSEAHFDLTLSDGFFGKMDPYYLLIFGVMAGVILISSLTNYCSLTLSQSVERTKEIGVRRAIGARRSHLLSNYFFESLVLTSLAFVFSMILTELSLPLLEELINRPLGIHLFENLPLLAAIYGVVVVLCFISILYPAYIVSNKKINEFKSIKSASGFSRNSVIDVINGIQVAIFIFLLSTTFFVNQQLDFVQHENLGFDKEQVLLISVNTRESIFKKDELKASFASSQYVDAVALTMSYPISKANPRFAKKEQLDFIEYQADAEFLDIFDLEVIKGRALENLKHHRQYVLINETAVEALGYEEPIGKQFNGKEIIGVISDFHAESKREVIKPLAYRLFDADGFGWLVLRLTSDDTEEAMADILNRYENVTNSNKIVYKFFDEEYAKIYSGEQVIKRLMQVFTVIALVISFFGVLGTSSYTVKRKLKEISIRKVLGASMQDLGKSVNANGLIYLALSIFIAVPLSYLWISNWLASFSYRVDVTLTGYSVIILITLSIIIPAMLIQTVKVYYASTINHLKEE